MRIIAILAFLLGAFIAVYMCYFGERFTIRQEVNERTNMAYPIWGDKTVLVLTTTVHDSHEMDQVVHSDAVPYKDNAEEERKKAEQWIESYLELEELNKSLK